MPIAMMVLLNSVQDKHFSLTLVRLAPVCVRQPPLRSLTEARKPTLEKSLTFCKNVAYSNGGRITAWLVIAARKIKALAIATTPPAMFPGGRRQAFG
jgi:hypothetical protein